MIFSPTRLTATEELPAIADHVDWIYPDGGA